MNVVGSLNIPPLKISQQTFSNPNSPSALSPGQDIPASTSSGSSNSSNETSPNASPNLRPESKLIASSVTVGAPSSSPKLMGIMPRKRSSPVGESDCLKIGSRKTPERFRFKYPASFVTVEAATKAITAPRGNDSPPRSFRDPRSPTHGLDQALTIYETDTVSARTRTLAAASSVIPQSGESKMKSAAAIPTAPLSNPSEQYKISPLMNAWGAVEGKGTPTNTTASAALDAVEAFVLDGAIQPQPPKKCTLTPNQRKAVWVIVIAVCIGLVVYGIIYGLSQKKD